MSCAHSTLTFVLGPQDSLPRLLQDPFGNYVIQTALSRADAGQQKKVRARFVGMCGVLVTDCLVRIARSARLVCLICILNEPIR